MTNSWIFQSDPKKADFFPELSDTTCIESNHSARQHRNDIKKGDIAFLWFSGKKRGIHAVVKITSSESYLIPIDLAENPWAKSSEEWMVDFKYQSKLIEPLFESEIKEINGLSDLSIIKRHYRGTNFPITNSKRDILLREIEKRGLADNSKNLLKTSIQHFPKNEISDIDLGLETYALLEGNSKIGNQIIRSRNRKLRELAIQAHGLQCSVCGFDFSHTYGELGHGFIEIHHLKPISTFKHAIKVNPKTDLVPVCANCHRMIHINPKKALSMDEIKETIR